MTDVREVALELLRAWTGSDKETVRRLLHEDVTFESPRIRLEGREALMSAMTQFARIVDSVDVVAAAAHADTAVVMYDLHTSAFGTLRAANTYTIVDGLVTDDRMVFDTARLAQE